MAQINKKKNGEINMSFEEYIEYREKQIEEFV